MTDHWVLNPFGRKLKTDNFCMLSLSTFSRLLCSNIHFAFRQPVNKIRNFIFFPLVFKKIPQVNKNT